MKRKSKYLVLLLLLLVVCGGMVTYAIYKTNKSGNATVNAARWNVVFKNGEEVISNNFDISLEDAEWTNELGNVASGKIAPGSSATFYITIDATDTETDVDYTAVIDESFDESDFEVTLADDAGTIPYSTVENAMIKQIPIRVVWNGNINDNNTKNNDDLLKKARDITIPIKLTAAQKLALRYTITFNDGAGNTISTKKVDEGSVVGTLPANPTRIGYTFLGWYDDPTNGNEVTTETEATQGMQIYAHWDVKFVRVTFDSDGGSNVIPREIQEGRSLPDVPTTTKDGFELIGWFDENDNQLTTSTILMNDITYTARWKEPFAGTLVYYDPVTNNTCNGSTYTGSDTCYKWRIIDTDETKQIVNIQMDQNLLNSKWASSNWNDSGPTDALTNLASATSSWKNSLLLDGYTYDTSSAPAGRNYGLLSCTSGSCSFLSNTINNVKARLITAEEIAAISGNNTWSLSNQYEMPNIPSWLLSNNSYWTMTPSSGTDRAVIYVDNSGAHGNSMAGNSAGLRPVITLPKSDLSFE